MKKFVSLILAAAMLISFMIPAFAQENEVHDSAECEIVPVIIVRGMDFTGLYLDYGTENQQPAINLDVAEIIGAVFKAIGSGILHFSFDATIDVVAETAYDIFKNLSMDKNGESVYNIGLPQYPESVDNYPELLMGEYGELGMVRTCAETFPDGHTYYLNYDWRADPFTVSDEINALVENAIKTTGHKKVNIVCCSMGGIMTLAYLNEYGYSKVNRCLFMSSTFCGAQVASDLLCGKIDIDADNLYGYLQNLIKDKPALNFIVKQIYDFGGFDALTCITDYILSNYTDDVFEAVLTPVFGHMLTLWGLVQPEDYEQALNYVFGGRTAEEAAFIEKTDKLQAMMAGRDELLNEMVDNGVEIAIVAHYDIPLIPVYENSDFNGDSILETYQMSGYATVAKYGETLGDDYVAENPKYLSPDRVVDLSTALFPEYTYIIKGATHVGGNYGSEYAEFLLWLLTYDGKFYAGASERYPQFMMSDVELNLRAFD